LWVRFLPIYLFKLFWWVALQYLYLLHSVFIFQRIKYPLKYPLDKFLPRRGVLDITLCDRVFWKKKTPIFWVGIVVHLYISTVQVIFQGLVQGLPYDHDHDAPKQNCSHDRTGVHRENCCILFIIQWTGELYNWENTHVYLFKLFWWVALQYLYLLHSVGCSLRVLRLLQPLILVAMI
jgi:hypothetical protein